MKITHLSQLQHPLLRPSSDDLINLTGWETFSKDDRWQVISIMEQRIDTLQGWQQLAKPGGDAHNELVRLLKGLRRKRMQIWLSFKPEIGTHVRLATV